MRRFVSEMGCRHRLLSEHFGQEYQAPEREDDAEATGCGACDVCLGETAHEPESGRVAQVLMSAVARCDQRFGAAHIADIVRGVPNEKVTKFGHENLSVFGLLNGRGKAELVSFLDQLVGVGALERGEHQTLVFGARGVGVMKGDDEVRLSKPVGGGSSARVGRKFVEARPLATDEKALFASLRGLRKSIADARGVPPYVVLSDSTLRDMCRKRPSTEGEMLDVKGVGKAKLKAFGEQFLEAIASA